MQMLRDQLRSGIENGMAAHESIRFPKSQQATTSPLVDQVENCGLPQWQRVERDKKLEKPTLRLHQQCVSISNTKRRHQGAKIKRKEHGEARVVRRRGDGSLLPPKLP